MSDYLMKEGSWKLKALSAHCDTDRHSFIVHECPIGLESSTRYWYPSVSQDEHCSECNEHPPAAMVGLWRLHNWSFIQKELR